MSFQENTYQQMSFTDSFSGLTAREQKALENSWAQVFTDEIFPAIDEKHFSVLYSDKASRPNTPVNVIVGTLIIKADRADGCAILIDFDVVMDSFRMNLGQRNAWAQRKAHLWKGS